MRPPPGPRDPRAAFAIVATAFAAACGGGDHAAPARPPRPNVVLIVVDTLRADALGSYGNPAGASPFLDAFAGEAVLYENAHAPSPHTAPSHASLFTSTYPATHEVWNEVFRGEEMIFPALSGRAVTLAEVLRDDGYATAAFADGGWVVAERGLDQGFETFDSINAGVVDRVDHALAWLEGREDDRPYFLFLHTYEVHAPYVPPPDLEARFAGDYDGPLRARVREAREQAVADEGKPLFEAQDAYFAGVLDDPGPADVAYLRAMYLAELAHVDAELQRFLGVLRARGDLDRTIVVVTSDHGEEFGEHGRFGHEQLYEETLRIPLLVRTPDGPRGLRTDAPVTLLDLMPSVLAAVGAPVPDSAAGSAFDLRGTPRFASDRLVVGDCVWKRFRQLSAQRGRTKAYFQGRPNDMTPAVYDLAADPGEIVDLASTPEGGAFAAAAAAALEVWESDAVRHREIHGLTVVETAIDDYGDRIDELRALGYVGN